MTIRPNTKLQDIPRNMGHFNDLTEEWQNIPMEEVEFDDEWYAETTQLMQRRREMLVFTDRSWAELADMDTMQFEVTNT